MIYFFVIGGILLFQAGVSYAIILASSGNGSFIGLGVMLAALMGIPVTALCNILLLRSARQRQASCLFMRLALVSLVLPLFQLSIWFLVSYLRL